MERTDASKIVSERSFEERFITFIQDFYGCHTAATVTLQYTLSRSVRVERRSTSSCAACGYDGICDMRRKAGF